MFNAPARRRRGGSCPRAVEAPQSPRCASRWCCRPVRAQHALTCPVSSGVTHQTNPLRHVARTRTCFLPPLAWPSALPRAARGLGAAVAALFLLLSCAALPAHRRGVRWGELRRVQCTARVAEPHVRGMFIRQCSLTQPLTCGCGGGTSEEAVGLILLLLLCIGIGVGHERVCRLLWLHLTRLTLAAAAASHCVVVVTGGFPGQCVLRRRRAQINTCMRMKVRYE